MARITIETARKRFGKADILRGIDLEISEGEMFALLGPSGCGKTTTLRAIAGLEFFDSGDILFDGQSVAHLAPAQRDIAFVFQLYTLYPHLSVEQNIAFPLKAAGVAPSVIAQSLREISELLQITAILKKKPSALSGGDMQRVTIARALMRNPAVLLMDEPLGSLDAKLREDMRTELVALHRRRPVTSVLVTHDQVEAMSMANRIAVMHEGVVQQTGSPGEVYRQPANLFVAKFIGAPSMNLLDARLVTRQADSLHIALAGYSGTFTLRACNAEASGFVSAENPTLGIRPEDITLRPPEAGAGLNATVLHYEPLGLFDLVTVRLDAYDTTLRARAKPRAFRQAGTPVVLGTEPMHIHVFDAATGLTLL